MPLPLLFTAVYQRAVTRVMTGQDDQAVGDAPCNCAMQQCAAKYGKLQGYPLVKMKLFPSDDFCLASNLHSGLADRAGGSKIPEQVEV